MMPWAVFFWDTLGPCICVYITSAHTAYLNIVADQVYHNYL